MKKILALASASALAMAAPCDAHLLRGGNFNVTPSGVMAITFFGTSITAGAAVASANKCAGVGTATLITSGTFTGCAAYNGLVSLYLNSHTIAGYTGTGLGTGYSQDLGVPNNGILEMECHVTPTIAAANSWCANSSAKYLNPNASLIFLEIDINGSQNTASLNSGAGAINGGNGTFQNSTASPGTDASFNTTFQAHFATLITELKATAVNAKIIIINTNNLSYLNSSGYNPDSTCGGGTGAGTNCGLADRWSRLINAFLNPKYSATPNNSTSFLIIDWACDAQRYAPAGNSATNNIHPIELNHQDLATLITNTMATPVAPRSGCTMTVTGVTNGPTFAPN